MASTSDRGDAGVPVRLLILITISMLVLVHHFYRVKAHDLSMWKGGGMGMFSTQDAPGTRTASIRLMTTEGEYVLNAAAIGKPLVNFRALPTASHLRDLCQAVVTQKWVASGDSRAVTLSDGSIRTERLATPAVGGANQVGLLELESVLINAWKVRVHVASGSLQRLPLGRAIWAAGDGGRACDING